MRLTIDPTLCKAEGRCYRSYPDLFLRGQDGKGIVDIRSKQDPEDIQLDAQAAANLCPRGAILLEE